MPLTPFHFGAGLLAKGLFATRVSLAAFVASQVVIDCETAYYLVTRQWPLHRWAHTFAVGGPVGMAVGALVSAVGAAWNRRGRGPRLPRAEVALAPALLGGAIGGFSHPVLDGIMHSDVMPLRPFSEANPFLGWLGLSALHLWCVAAGILGLALVRWWPR